MSNSELDKAYISPYDKFFFDFDANHPKTATQLKEFLKYKRIADMRDNKEYQKQTGEIWEDF